jgi:hypothetical protein
LNGAFIVRLSSIRQLPFSLSLETIGRGKCDNLRVSVPPDHPFDRMRDPSCLKMFWGGNRYCSSINGLLDEVEQNWYCLIVIEQQALAAAAASEVAL